MRRRFGTMWVATGLALFGTMIAGDREAQATVAAKPGITITGEATPVIPDPVYDYTFSVTLNNNLSYLDPGGVDSFTITGLPASGTILSASPNDVSSWEFTYNTTGSTSITWTYENGPVLTQSSNPIGPFTVEISFLSSSGIPTTGSTLGYSYTIDGGMSSGNSMQSGSPPIVLNAVVPEPSSAMIVLLTGGSGAICGLVVRARRAGRARGPS